MYHKLVLVGYLGKDPESKFTTSGMQIVNFAVATSEHTKGENKKTEWFNCKAFGKLAEVCDKYLKKGSLVLVEGQQNTSKWEDKNGYNHNKTEWIINKMKMLTFKEANEIKVEDNESITNEDLPF